MPMLLPALAALALLAPQNPTVRPDTTTLVIVATSDVHGRATSWDYERDREAPLGLVRAARVVDSLRRAYGRDRVILVDAGDLLQGNPFATYFARIAPAAVHPMVAVMNRMGYDVATPGNHEYNFGIPVLERMLRGARFRYVSANIVREPSGAPRFATSVVLVRGGVRVGITGVTTPGVMVWDAPNVHGRLRFLDMAAAAPPVVRRLRESGADVTVVLAHSGLDWQSSYDERGGVPPENHVAAMIAAAPEADVVVIGHTHREIADSTVGTTLVVQPGYYARSVAVVRLTLVRESGRWRLVAKRGELVPLRPVPPDSALAALLAPAHERVRAWAATPVGASEAAMPERTARFEDTPVVDFINEVQRRTAGAELSATAAFDTAGGIPAGPVRLRDLVGIYPYDNFLVAVRISGADLKAYLEHSARYFRRMGSSGPVVNDSVPGYNFDIVSGAEYELDLTQPLGHRVASLTVRGRAVAGTDSFTLALNNYRQQGGGGFPAVTRAPLVYSGPGEFYIRDLLAEELRRRGTIRPEDYFVPSWRIRGMGQAGASGSTSSRDTVDRDRAAGMLPTGRSPWERRDSIVLRVLATNDFHGALEPRVRPWSNRRPVGGAAALAGMMDRLAAECACPSIRLDGGDVMQGSAASNLTFGRASVDAFNAMGVAAAAIGNHDFDWTIDTLVSRMSQARFAWLSANIRETATHAPPAWARPWTVTRAGALRVAVVGFTTPGTTTSTNPVNVTRLGFLGAASLDSAIAAARAEHPDVVIVVAHAGAFCNPEGECQGEIVDLARDLTHKPDLIVSGHTHSLVNTVVNGIPIVQARSDGTSLGVADVVTSDSGRAVRVRVETVWADREQPDTTVARVVEAYESAVRPLVSRPIATLSQDLMRGDSSALGDLVADAVREAASADVGLVNRTGIRADLLAGTVTWGDAFAALPFGNFVVKLNVSGAVLRQALEHALASGETGAFVSGLAVRADLGAPAGRRVVSLTLADGRPVRDDATYTLGTFDFLANGGSGYSMLRDRPLTNTGIEELDAFVALLQRLPQPIRTARPYAPRIARAN